MNATDDEKRSIRADLWAVEAACPQSFGACLSDEMWSRKKASGG